MKKVISIFGLTLVVVVLSGCGSKTAPQERNASVNINQPAKEAPVTVVLPESVVTQPGKNADEEIKNIDKDLQSVDDASLNQGLSDKDLGL